jgi:hypothetical protein
MINVSEKYEKAHAEYILALVEYHNAYLKYIKGGMVHAHRARLRRALRTLNTLNRQMIKELTEIQRAKVQAHAEAGKYEWQRTRSKKGNDNVNN